MCTLAAGPHKEDKDLNSRRYRSSHAKVAPKLNICCKNRNAVLDHILVERQESVEEAASHPEDSGSLSSLATASSNFNTKEEPR